MVHHHITGNLLSAVLTGRISTAELVLRLILHLEEVCPSCQEGLDEFADEREAEAFDRLDALMSETLVAKVKAVAERRRELRPVARKEFEELLRLAPEDRCRKVCRARKRFRNAILVDHLLSHARERLAFDPGEACGLADLAIKVALRLSVAEYGKDFVRAEVVRAQAFKANALRAGGDLKAAEEILQGVQGVLDELPDPIIRAEVLSFAASLRKDQRRLGEAEGLLDEAAGIYREIGGDSKLGLVLVQRASIAYYQGHPEAGVHMLREALEMFAPEEEPRLVLCARHNLAWYLCESGCHAEAREVMLANQALYESFPDPWTQLRLHWLEGKIASSLGDANSAEDKLLRVREGFIDREIGYDAAMVSLDLAMLYARQGRSGDMKRLAEEMVHIFHSQDIHREAIAAFLIFRRAALAEAVTTRMIQDLAAHLRRYQRDPSLRQELPS